MLLTDREGGKEGFGYYVIISTSGLTYISIVSSAQYMECHDSNLSPEHLGERTGCKHVKEEFR